MNSYTGCPAPLQLDVSNNAIKDLPDSLLSSLYTDTPSKDPARAVNLNLSSNPITVLGPSVLALFCTALEQVTLDLSNTLAVGATLTLPQTFIVDGSCFGDTVQVLSMKLANTGKNVVIMYKSDPEY